MNNNRRRFAIIIIIAVTAGVLRGSTVNESSTATLDAIRPGEWYEVPNSRLRDVAASDKQFPWLRGGIYAITAAWAGGAFDTQRDRLYVGPGGGHGGYNGNEVYAFDLNDLKWRRLNDPDPVIPNTEFTPVDKAPFAMHTYDAVAYLPPPVDRYVVVGGWGTPRTYALDPDHPDHWEVYADHGTGRTGDLCGYDVVAQRLWLSTPISDGRLSEWDPFTHTWTLRRNQSPEPSYYETADVDYTRHLLVACGKRKLKVWDLTAAPEQVACSIAPCGGDTAILEQSSPGFCYVPLLDRFVAWGSGVDVYSLDLAHHLWTKHVPAASNRVQPGPPEAAGTFGRFRYVPSRNLFVLYNSVDQNVFLYRLSADRPNVLVSVTATAETAELESDIAAPAVKVEAHYADGSSRDVTADASYFPLDQTTSVDRHGKGVVTAHAAGVARVRAVYTDPALGRGLGQVVSIPVREPAGSPTLESLELSALRLEMAVGDHFSLRAMGLYSRGRDHFRRDVTAHVAWSSSDATVARIDGGQVDAISEGGPAHLTASIDGKSASLSVRVDREPRVWRIRFQVKPTSSLPGWEADNGQAYSDARGFGWLDAHDLASRDDRNSAAGPLLKAFVRAKQNRFRLKLPAAPYTVRVAMGDADYGSMPFTQWIACGEEKILYDRGHANTMATRKLVAGDKGLELMVNGPINYLVAVPLGTDIDRWSGEPTPPRQ